MVTTRVLSGVLAFWLGSCAGGPAEQPRPSTVAQASTTDVVEPSEEEPEWSGPTCKPVAPDQRISVTLPPTYTVEAVAHYVIATTCKRVIFSRRDAQREHREPERCDNESGLCMREVMGREIMTMVAEKLAPLEMTVIDRGEEAVFVRGTPAQPGPEPTGEDRIELDPNPRAGVELPRVELEREPAPPFAVDLGCKDGTCVFDGAAVQAALDRRSLSLRLIPNSKIPGGYKIYGLSESSFYTAAGLRNADTLVEIDGKPASSVLAEDDPVAALTEITRGLFEHGGSVRLRLTSNDGADKLVTLTAFSP